MHQTPLVKMATSPLSVLLGVTDTECKEKTSWNLNKIGGLPDWMNLPPSKNLDPICQLCKNQLYLVVQIYCPLTGSPYHRTLYVFACIEKTCQQDSRSWCVLRMQKLEDEHKTNDTSEKTNALDDVQDWMEDADDWGSDDDDDDVDNDASQVAETILQSISEPQGETSSNSEVGELTLGDSVTTLENLSLSEPTETLIPQNGLKSFVPHHVNVFTEPKEDGDTPSGYDEHRLLSEYAEREGLSSATNWGTVMSSSKSIEGKESSGEVYEKTLPRHGNVTFTKFTKRLGRFTEQCLRYCWSGKPLLISNLPDGFIPPVCQFCGATRIFEFQLMSSLITVLRSSHQKNASLDFGTLLIYSCSQSCWEPDCTARDECAVLQKDPDHDVIGHL